MGSFRRERDSDAKEYAIVFMSKSIDDRVTLDCQRHNASSISDEEALLFEDVRVSDTMTSVPVHG